MLKIQLLKSATESKGRFILLTSFFSSFKENKAGINGHLYFLTLLVVRCPQF